MEFVFKMMDFVLKMMDFVSKTMDLQGVGLSRGSGPSRQVRTPRNLSSFLIQNPACLPHNPSFLMQYSSFIRNIAPQSLFENHTHTHTHTPTNLLLSSLSSYRRSVPALACAQSRWTAGSIRRLSSSSSGRSRPVQQDVGLGHGGCGSGLRLDI